MPKLVWTVLAVLSLGMGVPCAYGDTMNTFDVSGTATNVSGESLGPCAAGATCSFFGTLTVDVTNGTINSFDAVDITLPGLPAFDYVGVSQQMFPSNWLICSIAFSPTNGESLCLDFTTSPTPGSLVGFDGGAIFYKDSDVFNNNTGGFTYQNISGSISPAVNGVPEPSSLALMLIGLGTLGLIAASRGMRHSRRLLL